MKFGRDNSSLETNFLTYFEKFSSAIFDFYGTYKESIKRFQTFSSFGSHVIQNQLCFFKPELAK